MSFGLFSPPPLRLTNAHVLANVESVAVHGAAPERLAVRLYSRAGESAADDECADVAGRRTSLRELTTQKDTVAILVLCAFVAAKTPIHRNWTLDALVRGLYDGEEATVAATALHQRLGAGVRAVVTWVVADSVIAEGGARENVRRSVADTLDAWGIT